MSGNDHLSVPISMTFDATIQTLKLAISDAYKKINGVHEIEKITIKDNVFEDIENDAPLLDFYDPTDSALFVQTILIDPSSGKKICRQATWTYEQGILQQTQQYTFIDEEENQECSSNQDQFDQQSSNKSSDQISQNDEKETINLKSNMQIQKGNIFNQIISSKQSSNASVFDPVVPLKLPTYLVDCNNPFIIKKYTLPNDQVKNPFILDQSALPEKNYKNLQVFNSNLLNIFSSQFDKSKKQNITNQPINLFCPNPFFKIEQKLISKQKNVQNQQKLINKQKKDEKPKPNIFLQLCKNNIFNSNPNSNPNSKQSTLQYKQESLAKKQNDIDIFTKNSNNIFTIPQCPKKTYKQEQNQEDTKNIQIIKSIDDNYPLKEQFALTNYLEDFYHQKIKDIVQTNSSFISFLGQLSITQITSLFMNPVSFESIKQIILKKLDQSFSFKLNQDFIKIFFPITLFKSNNICQNMTPKLYFKVKQFKQNILKSKNNTLEVFGRFIGNIIWSIQHESKIPHTQLINNIMDNIQYQLIKTFGCHIQPIIALFWNDLKIKITNSVSKQSYTKLMTY